MDCIMSTDSSTADSSEALLRLYDRILNDELRNHILYAKILVITGVALILLGIVLIPYYSPLGLLLILVGVLRSLNCVYDLTREDSLKKQMRLVKQEFGDISPK